MDDTVGARLYADKSLRAAARFWFVVALAGQFAFAISVAVFYGLTALRGNLQAWNRVIARGFETGATMSNTALVDIFLFATVISIAGALQLIPGIRNRFPVFHRWNGRLFVLAAFTQAITGIYLTVLVRRLIGDTTQHVVSVLGAVLIIFCAVMALRFAMQRDFTTHRRWLYVCSWYRAPPVHPAGIRRDAVLLGPIGIDSATFTAP